MGWDRGGSSVGPISILAIDQSGLSGNRRSPTLLDLSGSISFFVCLFSTGCCQILRYWPFTRVAFLRTEGLANPSRISRVPSSILNIEDLVIEHLLSIYFRSTTVILRKSFLQLWAISERVKIGSMDAHIFCSAKLLWHLFAQLANLSFFVQQL